MFIIGNFLSAAAVVLDFALTVYMYIIIVQAVLSWVNPDPYNPIVRFINQVTEPVLFHIRSRFPTAFGGIDFSPMIVILGVIFLKAFLVKSLFDLSHKLLIAN